MKTAQREARETIAKTMTGLDPAARERVFNRVIGGLPDVVGREWDRQIRKHKQHATTVGPTTPESLAAFESFANDFMDKPLYLRRNDVSRLHKLIEAIRTGRVMLPNGELLPPNKLVGAVPTGIHSFVVQHDWAGVLERAQATGAVADEWRLPFPDCVFEFRINNRTVMQLMRTDDNGHPVEVSANVQFVSADHDLWILLGDFPALGHITQSQTRAMCIALDAEVAHHEIVRGPAKLNEKRAKGGKSPVSDFHVVKLSGRHTQRAPDMGGTHRSPRLHFRRGHWRHFDTHTTWVRWHLVGNPDLGFIDKDYAL